VHRAGTSSLRVLLLVVLGGDGMSRVIWDNIKAMVSAIDICLNKNYFSS
jgi:hypothetical protein